MRYGKFKDFQEFYEAVEMGLDVEFFLRKIRYDISWRNNKPFICICPDGSAIFFYNTQDLLNNYKIEGVPIRDLWDEIDIEHIG